MNFHSYYRYPISPEPVRTSIEQLTTLFSEEASPWDDKEVLEELFDGPRTEHPPNLKGVLLDITGEWPNRRGFDFTYRTAQTDDERDKALTRKTTTVGHDADRADAVRHREEEEEEEEEEDGRQREIGQVGTPGVRHSMLRPPPHRPP